MRSRRPGRAEAWKALRADVKIAGEVDGLMRAVGEWFGADGVRATARERSTWRKWARLDPEKRADRFVED